MWGTERRKVEKFSLGKNEKVNASLAKREEEDLGPHYAETTKKDLQKPTIHKVVTKKPVIIHEEERAALILFLTGCFATWFTFR